MGKVNLHEPDEKLRDEQIYSYTPPNRTRSLRIPRVYELKIVSLNWPFNHLVSVISNSRYFLRVRNSGIPLPTKNNVWQTAYPQHKSSSGYGNKQKNLHSIFTVNHQNFLSASNLTAISLVNLSNHTIP